MTIIPDRLQFIHQEETKFEASVSESTMTRVGQIANFLGHREQTQHDWQLNGPYNIVSSPQLAVDGFITYPWAYEIYDVMMFIGSATGSGGTTELDVLWKPETSGAFASIFSTTPKLTTGAAFSSIRVGQSVSGLVAPVLSKTTFDAYDLLRLDVLSARTGTVEGIFLKVFIRPRDDS